MFRAKALLTMTLLCVLSGSVLADPRPMSAGDQPDPTENSQIAIVKETLDIDVRFDEMDVRATLLLENRGDMTELQVGFPCNTAPDAEIAGLSCDTKLVVKASKKAVKTKKIAAKTDENRRHWLWELSFAKNQQVEVVVSYTQPLVNDRYGIPLIGMGALTYELTTGAHWAGPIESLEMTVHIPLETVVHIAPAGYERSAGTIYWMLENVDPDEDVVVQMHPRFGSHYLGAFRAKSYKELIKAKEALAFDPDVLVKLADELEADADDVEDLLDYRTIIGQSSVVGKVSEAAIADCIRESARLIREAAQSAPEPE